MALPSHFAASAHRLAAIANDVRLVALDDEMPASEWALRLEALAEEIREVADQVDGLAGEPR